MRKLKVISVIVLLSWGLTPLVGIASDTSQKIDSLLHVADTTNSEIKKVDILITLAELYHDFNEVDKGLAVGKEALAKARELNYRDGIRLAHVNLGLNYYIGSQYPEALSSFTKALDYYSDSEEDQKNVIRVYSNMGNVYLDLGNHNQALDYYLKGLQVAEHLQDSVRMSVINGNIGAIYFDMEDYETALSYFKKAADISLLINNKIHYAIWTGNIGNVYTKREDHIKGMQYAFKALKINRESERTRSIAYNLSNIASMMYELLKQAPDTDPIPIFYGNDTLYFYQKNFPDSMIAYNEKALDIREKNQDKLGVTLSLTGLGDSYHMLGQYRKAQTFYLEALHLAKQIGAANRERHIHEKIYKNYKTIGDESLALKHFEHFIALKDSVFDDDKQKELGKLEARFDFEKELIQQQAEHEREKEIADEKAKRQRLITYSVGVGALFLLLFLLVLFNRIKLIRKQKNLIEKQRDKVSYHAQLVEEKNTEIMDSIAYAKRIQEAILPSKKTLQENLPNGFILFKPKDVVSGDFYWMERSVGSNQKAVSNKLSSTDVETKHQLTDNSEGGTVYLAAADCTGHGVPGAMVSVVCSNALSKSLLEENITEPAKILDRTRELVIERFGKSEEDVKDGMDISLVALTQAAKSESGESKVLLQWSGANNPLWIVSKREHVYDGVKRSMKQGEYYLHEIGADKQPIGKYIDHTPFTNHELNLLQGEAIYMFSDGFPDQFGGEKAKKFKAANFKKMILSIQNKSMDNQKKEMDRMFEDWKGDLEQIDDVCVIGVRVSAL